MMPELEMSESINEAVGCCDDPDIDLSDWGWNPSGGYWYFDGICRSCWDTSGGKIHAVDVEVTR